MPTSHKLDRRGFIGAAGMAGMAALVQGTGEKTPLPRGKYPLRVGAMQGVFGRDVKSGLEAIELASKAGLDGITPGFSAARNQPGSLNDKKVQNRYREAALQFGIQINSIAIGALGNVPLKSEPRSAVWLIEAIKCARSLGAGVILCPILGPGNVTTEEEFKRLIEVLRELGPYAEDEGVVLALECWMSGKDQLRVVTQAKSSSVKIYYDPRNALAHQHNPLEEITLLGEYIAEVHVKNAKLRMREKEPEGLDHAAVADALKSIGYKGWICLETFPTAQDPVADVLDDVKFVREVYSIFT